MENAELRVGAFGKRPAIRKVPTKAKSQNFSRELDTLDERTIEV
jgi:hypothetical protein